MLVIGNLIEGHSQNTVKVFNYLGDAGLRLKPTKFKVAQTSVEYLFRGRGEDQPKEATTVHEYPIPTSFFTCLMLSSKLKSRGERLWEFNLSRFSNITYHDYDNNHDYDIIQVMQKTITSLCKVAAMITLF